MICECQSAARVANQRRLVGLATALTILAVPCAARANPVAIDGQSLIAFAIVAFWALVIESGIVTLTLFSAGPLVIPLFGTLLISNVLIFLFAFLPLTSRVTLWLLEPGVVLVDAVLVRLVTALPFTRGSEFVGVTWLRATLASLLGNTASYFVGVLAGHSPWIDTTHRSMGLE